MALSFEAVDDRHQWFAPDLPGNRENADPFAVLISQCSAQEMRKLEREALNVTGANAAGFFDRGRKMAEQIFRDHVHGVRGFDLGGDVPANGAELLAALSKLPATPAKAIFDGILDAIQDSSVLRAGLLDRPGPSSGS